LLCALIPMSTMPHKQAKLFLRCQKYVQGRWQLPCGLRLAWSTSTASSCSSMDQWIEPAAAVVPGSTAYTPPQHVRCNEFRAPLVGVGSGSHYFIICFWPGSCSRASLRLDRLYSLCRLLSFGVWFRRVETLVRRTSSVFKYLLVFNLFFTKEP
jgi:hypothetical protein